MPNSERPRSSKPAKGEPPPQAYERLPGVDRAKRTSTPPRDPYLTRDQRARLASVKTELGEYRRR